MSSMAHKKYLVIGGEVTSKNDRQRHYVSARRLVDLYRVRIGECILFDDQEQIPPYYNELGLVVLRPDYEGRYELPREAPYVEMV